MDSFFASLEIREKPHLKKRPVAVGGKADERGVLTTCNYIARKYGLHSAMSSKKALQICKDLVILPVNITKYKEVSKEIFKIFKCYTKKVEPISIDEAYLDVSHSDYCRGDPEEMARQIRSCIKNDFDITASAGISSNKLVAKICSDWKKPDNQFSVCDSEISNFMKNVPLRNIPGIGKMNYEKCKSLKMEMCSDMYDMSELDLVNLFGSYGFTLFKLIRGLDDREVEINKIRKSISVEDTFIKDLHEIESCKVKIYDLHKRLVERCRNADVNSREIKEIFLKIKFNNFETITRQKRCESLEVSEFVGLFTKNIQNIDRPIRLIGVGFKLKELQNDSVQYDIFNR